MATAELKIRSNITYIVAAVVIQDDKVLLTQEAFHPCKGQWYLPAGRMEPNETVVVSTGEICAQKCSRVMVESVHSLYK